MTRLAPVTVIGWRHTALVDGHLDSYCPERVMFVAVAIAQRNGSAFHWVLTDALMQDR